MWSTVGRPTRMALKLLLRLPRVIRIILTQHMHLRFCLEKKLTHGRLILGGRRSKSSSIEDLAARKSDCLETSWEVSLCHRLRFDPGYERQIFPRKKVDPRLIDFGWTAIHVVDRRATDSDGLETSWERSKSSSLEDFAARKSDCLETSWKVSLCHRLHFDPAYAPDILPRKKVDPRLIDFGWTAIHVVDRRATDSDGLETSWEASSCHRDHFDSAYARYERQIFPRKKVDPRLIDFGCTAIHVVDRRATDSDGLETSWLHFDPSYAREILPRKKVYHDSLIFDGRRSTWSTAGRPTRMALKLLGRLPCVMGLILTQHMHVRFCLEKKGTGYIGDSIFRDHQNTAVVRGGRRWPSVVAGHRGATSQGHLPRDHPHDYWASMGHGVSAQFGTITWLPVHPASQVLLTKNGETIVAGPYLRLSRLQGGQAVKQKRELFLRPLPTSPDSRTLPSASMSRFMNFNPIPFRNLHRRPLCPSSRPRFCSDRRALQLIRAWHLPRRSGIGRALQCHPFSGLVDLAGQTPWSVFQIGPNGEPAGLRQERAGAEARQTARATIHNRDDDVSTGLSTAWAWAATIFCIGPHPEHIGRSADRLTPFHIRPGHTASPHPLPSRQFQALFDSLFKVLFIFPSRYLFTIGLSPVLALDGIYCPNGAEFPNNPSRRQRLVPRLTWGRFGKASSLPRVLQPIHRDNQRKVGLVASAHPPWNVVIAPHRLLFLPSAIHGSREAKFPPSTSSPPINQGVDVAWGYDA
ncbi:Protein TAR1 [Senna tora]|uniref:Protein TAR1 n=1 Tax=Senna tora TaxID=362788 RepID=A0A834SQD3_9FABA|nr:Protein TAR1 [Senna tora]